jgi:hypothetical protein
MNKHEGIFFKCSECDHQANTKGRLTTHIKSQHQGVRYFCELSGCDYSSSISTQLKNHHLTIHEGLRFSCDQCTSIFTSKPGLRHHIQSKHEGFM